jgi:hypothetical protein
VVLLGPVLDPLVAVCLAGLGEEDQRRRVGGLEREREVEKDERVRIPAPRERERVEDHPRDDDDRLPDDVLRRAEETGDALCDPAERVGAKRPAMFLHRHRSRSVGRSTDGLCSAALSSQDRVE